MDRSEASKLFRTLAVSHKRAYKQGNAGDQAAVEDACRAIAAFYGIPVTNANLFLAGYWPEE